MHVCICLGFAVGRGKKSDAKREIYGYFFSINISTKYSPNNLGNEKNII
jgi:hypothetical protein